MKFGIVLKQIRRPCPRRRAPIFTAQRRPYCWPPDIAPLLGGRSAPTAPLLAGHPIHAGRPILARRRRHPVRAVRARGPCLCRRRQSSGPRPCPRRQGYRGAATTSTPWSPPAVDPLPPCGSCPRRLCTPCALSSLAVNWYGFEYIV
jgi:hypothetical protein